MEKAFKGINHGSGPMDIKSYGKLIELRPIEIHTNQDGSLENQPSFAIMLGAPVNAKGIPTLDGKFNPLVIGQITLKMFNEGLADIGYKIVKI